MIVGSFVLAPRTRPSCGALKNSTNTANNAMETIVIMTREKTCTTRSRLAIPIYLVHTIPSPGPKRAPTRLKIMTTGFISPMEATASLPRNCPVIMASIMTVAMDETMLSIFTISIPLKVFFISLSFFSMFDTHTLFMTFFKTDGHPKASARESTALYTKKASTNSSAEPTLSFTTCCHFQAL